MSDLEASGLKVSGLEVNDPRVTGNRDLMPHLRALGVPLHAAQAFQALLRTGPSTLDALAEHLAWGAADTSQAVDVLVDLGLAASAGPDHRTVCPAEPTIALEHLVHVRSAELQQAHAAMLNGYRAFQRATGAQQTDHLVEVVTGPQIEDRIWQLERAVESEVVRFDSPPYHTHGRPNPTELDNLGRGVSYRVVYASNSVGRPDYYAANIQPCIAAGEDARVLPSLPVKLTVFDQRVALVSMSSVEADDNDTLLLVYPSSLLSALLGLFEACWRSSLPMHLGNAAPSMLRPMQRKILELLASGIPDETIAQLLKISRRTLSRNVEHLYDRTGAGTRFQLALHASRQGWI